MTIKHLVISGGAYRGLYMLGAYKYLIQEKFIKYNEIKTIHCVSVGSLFAVLICLNLNLDQLEEYIVNKPWDKLFNFSPEFILKITNGLGIYDINVFIDIYSTLFKSKGLSKDITLKELYEYSNIEMFIYSTRLSNWKKQIFSYKTHPDLKVIDATYMSSTLPCVFKPIFYDNSYHLDGGLINSYPLNECLDCSYNRNEILSIVAKNDSANEIIRNKQDINLFSFSWCILNNIISNSQENYYNNGTIKNELIIPVKNLDINDASNIIKNKNMRTNIIRDGEKFAKLFLTYNNYNTV